MCHSDLVIFVCLALVQMHIYVQYEGSMINHMCRRGKYRKKEKWLPFKKIEVILTKYFMYIYLEEMCICVQYIYMKFL